MESKEKMIERITVITGQSDEDVEHGINSLISVGVSSNTAAQALKQLSDEIRAVKNSFSSKKRKPTNYTKPRNRKKRFKY